MEDNKKIEVSSTNEVNKPVATTTPAKTEPVKTETKPVATTVTTTEPVKTETKPVVAPIKRQPFDKNRRPQKKNNRRFKRPVSEFQEKVVDIARVTTVVKGGRRFSFSALVVIGNKKGKVGYGHGKANEVPDAIKKAIKDAQINLITVPIIDKRTVPHEQLGKFLASKVLVKPAPKGKGIISSSAIRAVVELAGYTDIYTKSLGSRNKTNSVKATLEALKSLRTIEQIAALRDKKPEDILG